MSKLHVPHSEVVALYLSGLSVRAVAKQLKIAESSAFRIINRAGVSRDRIQATKDGTLPRHTMNRQAFAILTPDTAWVLGIIFTDGSLDSHVARVTVTSRDCDMLEQVNAILQSSYPIGGPYKNQVYSVAYNGRELMPSLLKWGLTPNKTRTLAWPYQLPAEMLPHFIRGLFDGDGGFHLDKRNPFSFLRTTYTSGSHDFARALYGFLRSENIIKGGCYRIGWRNAARIELSHADTVRLAQWMYADSNASNRLARKYALVEPYL